MATGPWLTWLPLAFGRLRYRSGFIARQSADGLAPFRLLEKTARGTALERSGRSPYQGVR